MAIHFNKDKKTFFLAGKNSSYIFMIMKNNHLRHVYWGKKIRQTVNVQHAFLPLADIHIPAEPNIDPDDISFCLDFIPQEYPAYGNTDFRHPAYQIQLENGTTISELKYESHHIFKGKRKINQLPATFVEQEHEADTLEITLYDAVADFKVILSYTVFEEYDAITRSVRMINCGSQKINLKQALSFSLDFNNDRFSLLHLSGAWGRERHIKMRPLVHGTQSVESTRGASSFYHNPFIALLREHTDEHQGEVFAFNLIYSGNFLARAEVNHYRQTRVTMGINPFDFNWLLEAGQEFQTPEAVLVYSGGGLNKMSRNFHDLYRNHLINKKWSFKKRPVLVNHWEATYFNFHEDQLLNIAREAQKLGLALFVLDDGWFKNRNDDMTALGDWVADKKKLPHGLSGLGKKINQLGLQFGLWVEPEMISPKSELFQEHPDWCLHVPDRAPSVGRNQLVLDLSREEICAKIVKVISEILKNAPISYVKWDMNRNMTDIGSAALPPQRQRETAHRYMLGVYSMMEKITSQFPDILFESCAGGGGRFDPGMLYYMPQTWCSDDTDAVERLKIQYGTSLVYPLSSIAAHVSTSPNEQIGRLTGLPFRCETAFFGSFGLELDLTCLTEPEKEIVKKYIRLYQKLQPLILEGDFYRLLSPFNSNETAWMVVSKDQKEILLGYYRIMTQANTMYLPLKLRGLAEDLNYQCFETEEIYNGDELMNMGLQIHLFDGIENADGTAIQRFGDYFSFLRHFKAV